MAGRIRPEDVEAVRERTDIVKVVSGYLQLKKAGRDSLIGLCPFHTEKTPSLSVSPGKQLFYCFGCQEGGNVFRFLERLENLSFAEAVEKLAKDAGITLRFEGESSADRRQQGRRQVIHRAIGDAARLYHRMLLEGREGGEARAYLEARGITTESVERFGVGYAPGYPDFLLKRMTKSFSVDLMVEAGLVARDGSGTLRDRFRGRVVFPIHDLSGNPVGFGGRLLAGPGAPLGGAAAKYVNSPESPVYRKGSLLYNLNRAKADVTRSGRAWLVEGYTDVIALDQAGVREVVATCGTALGEEHIRLLSRFTDRLVLSFDSDEAGARAADRAYEYHQRYPVDLLVLVLPQGQDPADFALAQGGGEAAGQAFRALEERARPLVEYMIDRALRRWDLTDVEQQARAVTAGVEILLGLDDPARRDKYAALLADKAGVDVDAVLLKIDQALRGQGPDASQQAKAPTRLPPQQRLEREVLKAMVQEPGLYRGGSVQLGPEHFSRAEHRRVFQFLAELVRRPDASTPQLVAAGQASSDDLGRLISELAMERLETLQASQEYVERLFLRLEEFRLRAQAGEIRKRLERMNPLKAQEYEALYIEFVGLEGARRRVRAAQEAIEEPP